MGQTLAFERPECLVRASSGHMGKRKWAHALPYVDDGIEIWDENDTEALRCEDDREWIWAKGKRMKVSKCGSRCDSCAESKKARLDGETNYRRCTGFPLCLLVPKGVPEIHQNALIKQERQRRPWMPLAGGHGECMICTRRKCQGSICCVDSEGKPIAEKIEIIPGNVKPELKGCRICAWCVEQMRPVPTGTDAGKFKCPVCRTTKAPRILGF